MARIYHKARIGDIDIHYHLADFTDPWRKPPAEAFLLYSGYCRSLEFWHAWVPLLGRDFRVLRMDPRGYGESGKPAPGYRFEIEQLARDAFGLMDHLGIARVHWVGDSTGGAVGMAAALRSPQRVASITACNTTAKMAQQTVDAYAIGEQDQAAAIEKYGVYEWCRRTLQYRVDVSKIPPALGEWFGRATWTAPRATWRQPCSGCFQPRTCGRGSRKFRRRRCWSSGTTARLSASSSSPTWRRRCHAASW
jgi:pimeloyl-ACP methyl ester carboxylesterase